MTNANDLYKRLRIAPFLIAGPCVIENEKMVLDLAKKISKICEELGLTYIFKSSFDKANRTSITSFRGPGLKKGLKILEKVKNQVKIPITTDVHETVQVKPISEVVDIIQIPAFLCRQTDLLLAAGKTGKIVNIKKGQFLSGEDMRYPAEKVKSTGNKKIILTERGSMFGYNNLVVDTRNLIDMLKLGYPVIIDATHSTQKPGGLKGKSGGNREYTPYIARAAAAVGIKGFFFEVHTNPDKALCDGPNMIKLRNLKAILNEVLSKI